MDEGVRAKREERKESLRVSPARKKVRKTERRREREKKRRETRGLIDVTTTSTIDIGEHLASTLKNAFQVYGDRFFIGDIEYENFSPTRFKWTAKRGYLIYINEIKQCIKTLMMRLCSHMKA